MSCANRNVHDKHFTSSCKYYRRFGEVKRLIAALGHDIPVIDGGYDPAAYRAAVGNEFGGAEGGRKCTLCINSRLAAAVKKCAELGLGYCTTTLTASPLKNAAAINAAGTEQRGSRIAQDDRPQRPVAEAIALVAARNGRKDKKEKVKLNDKYNKEDESYYTMWKD